MTQTPEDRRPPMTPQLALRVAIVGSFALAMFAIIFFRLWFLQVLSGDQYLAQATVNRVRDVADRRPAGRDPRPQRQRPGRLDAGARGADLAARPAPLAARPADRVPPPRRTCSRCSTKRIKCKVARTPTAADRHRYHLAPIPCDVGQAARDPAVRRRDHQDDVSQRRPVLPRRAPEAVPRRRGPADLRPRLPAEDLAAQLFGTVGPITAQEVKEKAYRGDRSPTRSSGSRGWRAQYDRYLRGSRRRRAGAGRRAGSADRRSEDDQPGRRQQPRAVARHQAPARRPAGAGAVDRQQLRAPTAARSWR